MSAFLPGATIGMLGGGQLGRMFCLEARRSGYRTVVWTDEPEGSPAGQVADKEFNADYDDGATLSAFLKEVDVVTVEFENLPGALLERVERERPLRPGSRAVTICQNREREKLFLREHGFSCVPFAVLGSDAGLEAAVAFTGYPAVLKTAAFGYDGRGQVKVEQGSDLETAWERLQVNRAVLEAWVSHEREISVLVARGISGATQCYDICENSHRHHILDVTVSPAELAPEAVARARDMAEGIARELDYTGIMAVEMFLLPDGELLVNEIAPRPHNSGHHTIDACAVSQFGQQLRTVCGFDPAPPGGRNAAAMVNLLGDVWKDEVTPPDWTAILREPAAHLHLYGKASAREGRKMGHFTVLADTAFEARRVAKELQKSVDSSSP